MNQELEEFFRRMPKRPLPTLNETIIRWSKYVVKIAEWDKIGIDDYLLYLSCRERIAELLKTEKLINEYKDLLEKSDKKFIEVTIETEKSFIRSIKTKSCNKEENWFAYRVLKSHFEDWIKYAMF